MSNEKTKEQVNKIMTEKTKEEPFIQHSVDGNGTRRISMTLDNLRWLVLLAGLAMFALGRLSAF